MQLEELGNHPDPERNRLAQICPRVWIEEAMLQVGAALERNTDGLIGIPGPADDEDPVSGIRPGRCTLQLLIG